MTNRLTVEKLRPSLADGNWNKLREQLGWDNPTMEPIDITVTVAQQPQSFTLVQFAEKRGVRMFACDTGAMLPEREVRRRVEAQLRKFAHEHVIVFHTADASRQVWQIPKRTPGRPIRLEERTFTRGQSFQQLEEWLNKVYIAFEDEDTLTLVDVMDRIQSGVAADRVTKKFYDEFSKQRTAFERLISGIDDDANRRWYAAIMLNRLMFTWFLQSKHFLNNDDQYLPKKLTAAMNGQLPVQNFQSFYRTFLHALFHDGLNAPLAQRDATVRAMLGDIPYINGGIFERHQLELDNTDIQIPDSAFQAIFTLFGQYTWHLDDRPIAQDNHINPDVLGHIFEKFVNQKEKGAYYTKEDVTGYMSQNTIIPWILDQAKKKVAIAFDPGDDASVWQLLQQQPARYIYPSMKHGVIGANEEAIPLADAVAAGEHDVGQRGTWNQRATEPYALPTETWREYVHRRRRTLDLIERMRNGEVHDIDDLITYNLDIRQFAQDIVETSGGADLIKALWTAVSNITILDPTVGSGAFLFAAVRVLEPLAEGLLDRMQDLVIAEPNPHPHSHTNTFGKVLAEVKSHPNQRYFIMRQIILHNLYGVDIEEEAAEICKLRLFLLLVAQLKNRKAIEPLPDLDFNIRAGNSLVGYASAKEVSIATTGTAKTSPNSSLQKAGNMALDFDGSFAAIERDVKIADIALSNFKQVQIDDVKGKTEIGEAKRHYEVKLAALRDTLDSTLYKQLGSKEPFQHWRDRMQPFHWFAEFHEIVIDRHGFDIVIGNPPYVGRETIDYLPTREPVTYPDIYGRCLETGNELRNRSGRFSMIVPLSITFDRKYQSIRLQLAQVGSLFISSFDNIPAALFTGVSQRCSIVISQAQGKSVSTTNMVRWRAGMRPHLVETLEYATWPSWSSTDLRILPKIASNQELDLHRRITSIGSTSRHIAAGGEKFRVGHAASARNYLSVFLQTPPSLNGSDLSLTSGKKPGWVYCQSKLEANAVYAALCGKVGFWYWYVTGNGMDLTGWLVKDYAHAVLSLPDDSLRILASIGEEIAAHALECLQYKLNAGKYIGSFNYASQENLTSRADKVVIGSLGFDRKTHDEIAARVDRVLAINEMAGEKAIPRAVGEAAARLWIDNSQPTAIDLGAIDEFAERCYRLAAQ